MFLQRCTVLALFSIAGTACFPEVPYEAGKLGEVDDPGGSGGGDDGGSGSGDDGGGSGGDDGGDTCQRWEDADGDGYGAGEALSVDCDASGYAANADDCDDGDADIFPGAHERCNELDDDCDAVVDEDLVYDWYVDADSDGFGSGDSLNDCDPPEGSVANDDDCDDTFATINPDAQEVCNEVDDDCDGDIDDADASVDLTTATTWHLDNDGDGFGSSTDTELTCEAPGEHWLEDGSDCNDIDPAVHPDATEVCDGEDNDCDFAIDDADASLDLSTATEWHADTDGDSYGDPAVDATTCLAPSGTVADATDCDDGDSAVNPGAQEVCNLIDDDCDSAIDDADSSLDTTTGSAWYADSDSDGYGDATTEVYTCTAPSGTVADATDCDDLSSAVNPGATEICNGIDDDCDSDIDDADSSLDTSTADLWYYDGDGDGLGVSSPTTRACDEPSGYADNDDDCDDSGFTDLDGDGLQNCEDTDADGDGLSSSYDVDDEDDSLVRGPTGGFGGDGVFTHSATGTWSDASDFSLLASDGSSGDSSITVDDGSPFSADDEVLVFNAQGDDAGDYGYYFVTSVSGATLSIEPPLVTDFDSDDVVVVHRVPHYTTVNVSGSLEAQAWDGEGGGLVVFRATGSVTISGTVDASGTGYLGGDGVTGNSSDPTSGGTWSEGPAAATTYGTAVDGGGGAVAGYDDLAACGGGGGHGTAGGGGDTFWGNNTYAAGASYGDSTLATWYFGSGGGGGTPDTEYDGRSAYNITGDGGSGGGLIAIYTDSSITISGEVEADGEDGEDAQFTGNWWDSEGEIGGGGAGAGGTVLLVGDSITISGSVSAVGGGGGDWNQDVSSASGEGGDGGDGITRLEYTTASGTGNVDPSPSTGTWAE